MAAAFSVVDLCKLAEAEHDASSTSSKFFRDGDVAGGGFSWPEAEKTTSELNSQSALQALCEKYEVPADYTPTTIRDGRWAAACRTPPEGCICVYADALEAGMRIPLHGFYVEVLAHYGLAPSQLAPDAWRYLAAFVLLSHDAGVEPSLPAFRSFFSICTHGGDAVGWYHFSCTRHFWSRYFVMSGLFTGRQVPRSGWKSRFFLLRAPSTTPWPCAVEWGKPSRAAFLSPEAEGTCDTAVQKKLLDRATASLGIDLMQFLAGRSLPVGPQAAGPTPQQHKAGKVEAAAAAAAGPWSVPAPTRKRNKSLKIAAAERRNADMSTPPPGFCLVRQRQSSCLAALRNDGGSAMEGVINSTRETVRLAEKAMSELQEKEELQATKAEVTELRQTLMVANKEHAAVVAKLKQEHAAEVTRLKQVAEKEAHDAMKDMVLALLQKLDNSLLCSLQQEILRRLQTDQ